MIVCRPTLKLSGGTYRGGKPKGRSMKAPGCPWLKVVSSEPLTHLRRLSQHPLAFLQVWPSAPTFCSRKLLLMGVTLALTYLWSPHRSPDLSAQPGYRLLISAVPQPATPFPRQFWPLVDHQTHASLPDHRAGPFCRLTDRPPLSSAVRTGSR